MSESFKPSMFLSPKSVEELGELLSKHGDRARIIAGGTGIYEVAHRGLIPNVDVLIDITHTGLSYVRREGATLHIGAATTMSALWSSEELRKHSAYLGLIDALEAIQPVQIKNVATIGGSICTALPFFDLPVALLACNSRARIGPADAEMPLEDFLVGYFAVKLSTCEFLKEVLIPYNEPRRTSAFQKFGITADDWALANCGVSLLTSEGAEKIEQATIVFGGGVGEKPVRAKLLEERLAGMDTNDEAKIKGAVEEIIPKEIETVSDIRASSAYRMKLAKVLCKRTIIQASKRNIDLHST